MEEGLGRGVAPWTQGVVQRCPQSTQPGPALAFGRGIRVHPAAGAPPAISPPGTCVWKPVLGQPAVCTCKAANNAHAVSYAGRMLAQVEDRIWHRATVRSCLPPNHCTGGQLLAAMSTKHCTPPQSGMSRPREKRLGYLTRVCGYSNTTPTHSLPILCGCKVHYLLQ